MATILVVDDEAAYREMAGEILEQIAGVRVAYAHGGDQAVAMMAQEAPDAVLADLNMPDVDGLTLVERIRAGHPSIPVILMTSHGNERIAVRAIKQGAASYLSKSNLCDELGGVVQEVLSAAYAERRHRQLFEFLRRHESQFVINSDMSLVVPLVGHLQENLARMGICDDARRMRVGIALQEALSNAVYHGNLEVDSQLKQQGMKAYYALADQRRAQPPWSERRIYVSAVETRDDATYTIRDDGQGFDVSSVPDPTTCDGVGKPSGRGLFLIRTFMDEVRYNERGNQVTMIVRRG